MWLGHSYGTRAQNAPTIKKPFLARNSRKNYESAIKIIDRQIAYNNSTAVIYLNRGNALQRADKFDRALDDYIKALSIDSSLFAVHYQIGRLAAVSGTKLELGEESIKNSFLNQNCSTKLL